MCNPLRTGVGKLLQNFVQVVGNGFYVFNSLCRVFQWLIHASLGLCTWSVNYPYRDGILFFCRKVLLYYFLLRKEREKSTSFHCAFSPLNAMNVTLHVVPPSFTLDASIQLTGRLASKTKPLCGALLRFRFRILSLLHQVVSPN